MGEYIKREELMKFPIRRNHYDKKHGDEHFINGIETVLEYAENLPTVDAVPVVRCKDCQKMKTFECPMQACGYDDFCSRGERRTDNENR